MYNTSHNLQLNFAKFLYQIAVDKISNRDVELQRRFAREAKH